MCEIIPWFLTKESSVQDAINFSDAFAERVADGYGAKRSTKYRCRQPTCDPIHILSKNTIAAFRHSKLSLYSLVNIKITKGKSSPVL